MPHGDDQTDADVIVVGAGPGGAATAFHLARHGVNVLLLEKSEFPREKVCGDGLTPRAVKQLVAMGVDTDAPTAGPATGACGSSAAASGSSWTGPTWRASPTTASPGPGWTSTKCWSRRPRDAGAKLQTSTTVTGPVLDERTGRVVGVEATVRSGPGTADLPGAARRRRRRGLGPVPAVDGPGQADRPADRGGRAPVLPQPAPRRRLPGVVAGAAGPQRRRQAPARLRLDLRHGRRAGQRRTRRAELVGRVRQDQLPRDARRLDGVPPPPTGA